VVFAVSCVVLFVGSHSLCTAELIGAEKLTRALASGGRRS
jgi:hypothetical protein